MNANVNEHSQVTRCLSCRERIVFLMTIGGHRMPVNVDTVRPDDAIYERGRHVSHFTTCPQRDRWRKRR